MHTCGTMVLKPRLPYTSTEYTDASVKNGATARNTSVSRSTSAPSPLPLKSSASQGALTQTNSAASSDAANELATAIRMFARNSCCRPVARSRLIVRIRPVAAPISHTLATMLNSATATRNTPASATPSWVVTTASRRKLPPP